MPEPSFKPALSAQKTLFGQVRPDILDPVKKALGLRAFVPGLSCLEFAQNFLLPRRQLAGRPLSFVSAIYMPLNILVF